MSLCQYAAERADIITTFVITFAYYLRKEVLQIAIRHVCLLVGSLVRSLVRTWPPAAIADGWCMHVAWRREKRVHCPALRKRRQKDVYEKYPTGDNIINMLLLLMLWATGGGCALYQRLFDLRA